MALSNADAQRIVSDFDPEFNIRPAGLEILQVNALPSSPGNNDAKLKVIIKGNEDKEVDSKTITILCTYFQRVYGVDLISEDMKISYGVPSREIV